jgi:hypothetical protein
MFDTYNKGFVFIFNLKFFIILRYLISYLPRETIEPLFASLFELIGYPTDKQCGANISQRKITHLIEVVDKSKNKRLLRNQFINMTNTDWMDEDNGVGTLLVEYSC